MQCPLMVKQCRCFSLKSMTCLINSWSINQVWLNVVKYFLIHFLIPLLRFALWSRWCRVSPYRLRCGRKATEFTSSAKSVFLTAYSRINEPDFSFQCCSLFFFFFFVNVGVVLISALLFHPGEGDGCRCASWCIRGFARCIRSFSRKSDSSMSV